MHSPTRLICGKHSTVSTLRLSKIAHGMHQQLEGLPHRKAPKKLDCHTNGKPNYHISTLLTRSHRTNQSSRWRRRWRLFYSCLELHRVRCPLPITVKLLLLLLLRRLHSKAARVQIRVRLGRYSRIWHRPRAAKVGTGRSALEAAVEAARRLPARKAVGQLVERQSRRAVRGRCLRQRGVGRVHRRGCVVCGRSLLSWLLLGSCPLLAAWRLRLLPVRVLYRWRVRVGGRVRKVGGRSITHRSGGLRRSTTGILGALQCKIPLSVSVFTPNAEQCRSAKMMQVSRLQQVVISNSINFTSSHVSSIRGCQTIGCLQRDSC
jgi:hypothetical protein